MDRSRWNKCGNEDVGKVGLEVHTFPSQQPSGASRFPRARRSRTSRAERSSLAMGAPLGRGSRQGQAVATCGSVRGRKWDEDQYQRHGSTLRSMRGP